MSVAWLRKSKTRITYKNRVFQNGFNESTVFPWILVFLEKNPSEGGINMPPRTGFSHAGIIYYTISYQSNIPDNFPVLRWKTDDSLSLALITF